MRPKKATAKFSVQSGARSSRIATRILSRKRALPPRRRHARVKRRAINWRRADQWEPPIDPPPPVSRRRRPASGIHRGRDRDRERHSARILARLAVQNSWLGPRGGTPVPLLRPARPTAFKAGRGMRTHAEKLDVATVPVSAAAVDGVRRMIATTHLVQGNRDEALVVGRSRIEASTRPWLREHMTNEKEASGHQPQDDCLSELLRPLKHRAGPNTAHGADVDCRNHADDREQRYPPEAHAGHSDMVRFRFNWAFGQSCNNPGGNSRLGVPVTINHSWCAARVTPMWNRWRDSSSWP